MTAPHVTVTVVVMCDLLALRSLHDHVMVSSSPLFLSTRVGNSSASWARQVMESRRADWTWATECHGTVPGQWPSGACWWWSVATWEYMYEVAGCLMSPPFPGKPELS